MKKAKELSLTDIGTILHTDFNSGFDHTYNLARTFTEKTREANWTFNPLRGEWVVKGVYLETKRAPFIVQSRFPHFPGLNSLEVIFSQESPNLRLVIGGNEEVADRLYLRAQGLGGSRDIEVGMWRDMPYIGTNSFIEIDISPLAKLVTGKPKSPVILDEITSKQYKDMYSHAVNLARPQLGKPSSVLNANPFPVITEFLRAADNRAFNNYFNNVTRIIAHLISERVRNKLAEYQGTGLPTPDLPIPVTARDDKRFFGEAQEILAAYMGLHHAGIEDFLLGKEHLVFPQSFKFCPPDSSEWKNDPVRHYAEVGARDILHTVEFGLYDCSHFMRRQINHGN